MKDHVREVFNEIYSDILKGIKEGGENHKYLMVLRDIWELKLSGKKMKAYLRGLYVSGDYKLYQYFNVNINFIFKNVTSRMVLIINLYNRLEKDGIIS